MDSDRPELEDRWLRESDVVRLVSQTDEGAPIALAAKAGHNGVSHNHNDIGSFVFHVDGETLLCDPESGLYDLYRRHGQDQNLFANSIGHSVPKIGDTSQSRGAAFGGKITSCETSGDEKRVVMEIAGAYEIPALECLQRTLILCGGELVIEDRVSFDGQGQTVEAAFVMWSEPIIDGSTARIPGEGCDVVLTIEEPAGATWEVEAFEAESEANRKTGVLRRLTVSVSEAALVETRVRATAIR